MFDSPSETDSDFDEFVPHFITHIHRNANEFDKILRDSPCSKDGFDQLVAKDLSSKELAAVGRSARLDVADASWTDGDFTAEPESYNEQCSIPSDPEFHRVATLDTDKWKLEPDEIVHILVGEFGALGEDEKLIFEADAFIFNDVLIAVSLSCLLFI